MIVNFWLMAFVFLSTLSPLLAENTAPLRVVCLGDSITAGLGLDPIRAWPIRLQDKFDEANLPARVFNTAGSGETVTSVLLRLDKVLTPPTQILIIALGREEGRRETDLETLGRNLEKLIDQVREKSPQTVLVLAGLRLSRTSALAYHERFRALYPAIAQDRKVFFIPDLMENVQGVTRYLQADQIHPTSEGQKLIAENVWRVLYPVLVNKSSSPSTIQQVESPGNPTIPTPTPGRVDTTAP